MSKTKQSKRQWHGKLNTQTIVHANTL